MSLIKASIFFWKLLVCFLVYDLHPTGCVVRGDHTRR